MGKAFSIEMSCIPDTIEWATGLDVRPIASAWRALIGGPLLVIGSGGSLSAAHFAALLHEELSGHPAKVVTPLHYKLSTGKANTSVLILSAGGANKDILHTAECALAESHTAIASVIASGDSPLARELRRDTRSHVCELVMPTGRDGFLATNSLVATCILLLRGYAFLKDTAVDCGMLLRIAQDVTQCRDLPEYQDVLSRQTISVMGGKWGWPVAIDIESKFAEAALGNVQISDYRNYGHGRHHWLAKRGSASAILALDTPDVHTLAVRTLALIPSDVPKVALSTDMVGPEGTIELLVRSFRLTNEAGKLAGYDPGRPGVPEFGRRLYNLGVV